MSIHAATVPEAKTLYTARVHTTGGRGAGISLSSDGRLDVHHSIPGGPGNGTNPEQLLAAGWSACFEGAMGTVARSMKIALPADLAIDAEVDLNVGGDGYFLSARLNVSLPGIDRTLAEEIIAAADKTCPYSKAVRGNVGVKLVLV